MPLGLADEGEEDMDVDTDSSSGSDGWGRPFPFVVDSYPVEQPSHAVRLPPNYRGFLGEWLDVYEGPRNCDEDYEGPRDHAQDLEYMDFQSYRSSDDTSDTHESNDMNEAPESELLAEHDIDKLCIMVFGTRNRIARSFSSALYHRRVRGILGPVLGLVLTPGSPLVEVAIAWLGEAFGGDLVSLGQACCVFTTEFNHSPRHTSPGIWPRVSGCVAGVWHMTCATWDPHSFSER